MKSILNKFFLILVNFLIKFYDHPFIIKLFTNNFYFYSLMIFTYGILPYLTGVFFSDDIVEQINSNNSKVPSSEIFNQETSNHEELENKSKKLNKSYIIFDVVLVSTLILVHIFIPIPK